MLFTNAGECVIGVTSEEQCIMINFDYQQTERRWGIRMVQDSARAMGDEIIDELNEDIWKKCRISFYIHTHS